VGGDEYARSDTMATKQKITVKANPDADDCLAAASEEYIAEHPELAGWDLDPQWADDADREYVVLTVPAVSATER
jgi:hypothetical protein